MLNRNWPPEPLRPPPKPNPPPTPPEVWIAVLLFPLSPLAAWAWAALPGPQPYAPLAWPAGWALMAALLIGGAAIRTRRRITKR